MSTKPPTNGASAPPRPNHTLYCSNLPDKLPKPDLKRALYMLFSVHGPILDIICLKTTKMRGQAHVLFRDVSASTQALRACQGIEFFGKEMKVAFAATKSDTLAKLDGTFKQPAPLEATAAVENQASSLQQSIFAGPPGTSASTTTTTAITSAPPPGLSATASAASGDAPAQGIKRAREESDDEKEEAPMEVDDEEAMDESDSD